jgi:hypothetical protein
MSQEQVIADLAAQLKADYRSCFLGRSGHRVLADLARVGYLAETSFVPGDPGYSAFREGSRAVVLYIFDACDMLGLDKWVDQFGAKKTKKK